VIDTDAANEIDDQFALAWLLLSRDRSDLQGIYAAPFSFEYRRQEMLRAHRARDNPLEATQADPDLLHQHADRIADLERKGSSLESMAGSILQPPTVGMERSHAEILTVFDRMGIATEGLVHRGATE